MQWLRRSFIAGFFVTVPLVISVAALVWIFRLIDGFVGPFYAAWLPWRDVPGLGILTTALRGAAGRHDRDQRHRQARCCSGPRATCCACPSSAPSTRRSSSSSSRSRRTTSTGSSAWCSIEDAARGFMLGFLTKEFTVDRGQGPEPLVAVYVPTNHLYLGDVIICPRDKASFPDITVEQGIRIFLTGGMALPSRVQGAPRRRSRRATSAV